MGHAAALQSKLAASEKSITQLTAEKKEALARVARFAADSGVELEALERALDLVKRQQEAQFLYSSAGVSGGGGATQAELAKLDSNQVCLHEVICAKP
jgi:hypothetical protein